MNPRRFCIIPAYNEQESIAGVVEACRAQSGVVIVGDNNSKDRTAELATAAGAIVVPAPRQGYGSACLSAIDHVRSKLNPFADDILIFVDADHCDDLTLIPNLCNQIESNAADLVIGSRLKLADPGSLTPPQKFGNILSTILIRLIWRHRYTDLGPFRAIRWQSYEQLNMSDPDFGWTVEMQIKALQHKLRVIEIDVPYRRRVAGKSKISGTVRGVFFAGKKILWVIFRSIWQRPAPFTAETRRDSQRDAER
jgi:glycosyltransferase involved in cell wall biosynthesis